MGFLRDKAYDIGVCTVVGCLVVTAVVVSGGTVAVALLSGAVGAFVTEGIMKITRSVSTSESEKIIDQLKAELADKKTSSESQATVVEHQSQEIADLSSKNSAFAEQVEDYKQSLKNAMKLQKMTEIAVQSQVEKAVELLNNNEPHDHIASVLGGIFQARPVNYANGTEPVPFIARRPR